MLTSRIFYNVLFLCSKFERERNLRERERYIEALFTCKILTVLTLKFIILSKLNISPIKTNRFLLANFKKKLVNYYQPWFWDCTTIVHLLSGVFVTHLAHFFLTSWKTLFSPEFPKGLHNPYDKSVEFLNISGILNFQNWFLKLYLFCISPKTSSSPGSFRYCDNFYWNNGRDWK